MAWDDTQTATDLISYTEWNNMVTYVKNPDEVTSYSIDIASTPIITVEATGITVDGTITVGAYTLTIDETASLSDYLHTSGGTVTGDLTMSGADIVLGTQTIGYDNTGGLSFDADNDATLSGDLTMGGNDIVNAVMQDTHEKVNTVASSGSTETLDIETANVHDVTLTDACTFTFSNPASSGTATSFTLICRQDATGSRAVTWPASVEWAGGVTPTLCDAEDDVDILTFLTVDGGTTWYGFHSGYFEA